MINGQLIALLEKQPVRKDASRCF